MPDERRSLVHGEIVSHGKKPLEVIVRTEGGQTVSAMISLKRIRRMGCILGGSFFVGWKVSVSLRDPPKMSRVIVLTPPDRQRT
jgi:hypothetical protein